IVSQIQLPGMKIADEKWTPMIARLVRRYQATCMPIFVKARNPLGFYLAKFIHRRLRTALLIRAMLSQSGRKISAMVGAPIPATEVTKFDDVGAATDFLRMSCDILDSDAEVQIANPVQSEISPDIDVSLLSERLESLSEFLLLKHNSFRVYCAPYSELGCVMDQIAICRERTFRAIDAGSGEEVDRNAFDQYYWHLFVWDEEKSQIAGGYRLERADKLAELHGIDSMCSQSVYKYDLNFISQLGKAIELSRSFVVPEFQMHPKVLDLLWKGIARFVLANPGYHTLFGPVSIPPKYSIMARSFLADAFLLHYSANSELRRRVRPIASLDIADRPWSKELVKAASDIPFINRLLGRIDDGKSIPILIRRYLALNGKFIAFGINDGFNQSLDGLVMVDLREAPEKYLKRYLGVREIQEIQQSQDTTNAA
ncbi:MAG: lysophospholipid acyltransferase family protein, partial [Rhizobiaceae bacterium]